MSLPTWERGLKPKYGNDKLLEENVAPHMGAWIETLYKLAGTEDTNVAPHMGAWIETAQMERLVSAGLSLPTWERGLKPKNANLFA